ncbi:MAG: helix-turn-helix transcriptional regulator [Planctomycetes bacterium]|nr:helix-turn-helix transcriptional regulator [Planctomycetota bacterium]
MNTIIRFHRKQSGLTQSGLAELAGVGKTAVFDLEKGKPTVRLDTLLKVCQALNIQLILDSPLMAPWRSQNSEAEEID